MRCEWIYCVIAKKKEEEEEGPTETLRICNKGRGFEQTITLLNLGCVT